MPENYTVKLTSQAEEQLCEIADYIRFTLQSPNSALNMLRTLEKAILSLDLFPNRVPLTEEEPWRSQGFRKLSVKNYLVYFWVNEDEKKVQVTGVVYGRRDQREFLSNLNH